MLRLLKIAGLFAIAATLEVSGVYQIWQWKTTAQPLRTAVIGVGLIAAYGFVNSFQELNFGRAFAAYGGVFIVFSLLGSWWWDQRRPDLADTLGASICLIGAAVIAFTPRAR